MPKNQFNKGNKYGGKHGGDQGGRPANWFRTACAKILEKKKLVNFVGRVAAGEESEEKITKEGDILLVKACIHDRLNAFEMLANWGVGKPLQTTELVGPGGTPLGVVALPMDSKGERGRVSD